MTDCSDHTNYGFRQLKLAGNSITRSRQGRKEPPVNSDIYSYRFLYRALFTAFTLNSIRLHGAKEPYFQMKLLQKYLKFHMGLSVI